MENYALKARIVAAERLDVLHKESCKSSNVLHKILSAFSFFNGWGQSLMSGGWNEDLIGISWCCLTHKV